MRTRRRSRIADRGSSHDRWLVSYADFITLLFAVFTVLYASSTVDKAKLSAVVDSMQAVFAAEGANAIAPLAVAPPKLEPPDLSQDLTRVKTLLERDLATQIGEGRVSLLRDQRGLVISIQEAGSFATGRAELPPEAMALFSTVGGRLRTIPNAVRVEGHTDDVPIHTSRYQSNWQLSTARATEVVAFLIGSAGLDPRRLSAAGYAEFHPRSPNDSPNHRATNRRVDLVVLNSATRLAEEPGTR